ncbi:MAG: universal stress protein [Desulfovibrionaceae bacterium]|nr:universal stress protein [Desulfovibrionaceae bacterium]MDD4951340.1 universal stress protein [Desulfovibrionaceae bacterium]
MDWNKVLVAFDASENSFRAVEYAGEMTGRSKGFYLELVYVERLPDRDMYPDDAAWKARCREHEAEVRAALARARGVLTARGLDAGSVGERYEVSCRSPLRQEQSCSLGTSIAHEILRIQQEGGFGTVVIGRRGVSKAEEFLFGSVSNKIIHAAKGCTVWVVS